MLVINFSMAYALKPGLYITATPIGNLEDITLRALNVLKLCDMIACEDTRTSKKLLQHYGIEKPLVAYHDHTDDQERQKIIQKLQDGQSIALISDAGMPLISDPGYKLVQLCYELGIYITVIPGASAVLSGLVLSGMPTDQFVFCGFADPKKWGMWQYCSATLVFYEAPHRLVATLQKMKENFSARSVAVVREITKLFEEVKKGSFQEVIDYYEAHPPKGEIVIILGSLEQQKASSEDIDHLLLQALKHDSLRDASAKIAKVLGFSKKEVYARALEIIKR